MLSDNMFSDNIMFEADKITLSDSIMLSDNIVLSDICFSFLKTSHTLIYCKILRYL
jgi:hypothetical protein